MAAPQANTIAGQVQQHGEILARLTVIVEQDHADLHEIKEALAIIAKALAKDEAIKETRETFKARLVNIFVPLVATLIGGLIGYIIR